MDLHPLCILSLPILTALLWQCNASCKVNHMKAPWNPLAAWNSWHGTLLPTRSLTTVAEDIKNMPFLPIQTFMCTTCKQKRRVNITEGMMGYDTHLIILADGKEHCLVKHGTRRRSRPQSSLRYEPGNGEKRFVSQGFESNVDGFCWNTDRKVFISPEFGTPLHKFTQSTWRQLHQGTHKRSARLRSHRTLWKKLIATDTPWACPWHLCCPFKRKPPSWPSRTKA